MPTTPAVVRETAISGAATAIPGATTPGSRWEGRASKDCDWHSWTAPRWLSCEVTRPSAIPTSMRFMSSSRSRSTTPGTRAGSARWRAASVRGCRRSWGAAGPVSRPLWRCCAWRWTGGTTCPKRSDPTSPASRPSPADAAMPAHSLPTPRPSPRSARAMDASDFAGARTKRGCRSRSRIRMTGGPGAPARSASVFPFGS